MKIQLDLIDLPETDLRASIDEDDLEELANSLRDYGQLQAISVRPRDGGRFEVVYGARRTRAARLLGWTEINGEVAEGDDEATNHAKKMIENIHRSSLTPIEEGYGLLHLIGEGTADINQLRRQTGKSRQWIISRLELVDMPDDMQALVQTGQLTIGVARQLAKIEHDETRRLYVQYAIDGGCTEDTARSWLSIAGGTTTGLQTAEQVHDELMRLAEDAPQLIQHVTCFDCKDHADVRRMNTVVMCGKCQQKILGRPDRMTYTHTHELDPQQTVPIP